MSLSRPVVALGALVVVGVAIAAGESAANASSITKPEPLATVTVGKGFKTAEPLCYNDGKALTDLQQKTCQVKAATAARTGSLPSINVRTGDMVSAGMDVDLAKKGWDAFTNGGTEGAQGGQAVVSTWNNTSTYSGQVKASTILSSSAKTVMTVVAMDKTQVYGVWYYELDNQGA